MSVSRIKLLPLEYVSRNVGRSPVRTALTAAASALVVAVVLAALAFLRGMNSSLELAASPDNAILLGAGSEDSAERSVVPIHAAAAAAAIPGVRGRLGVDYVSPELHMALAIQTSEGDEGRLGVVRGVTPAALLVHRQVRVTEGRFPRAGSDEVLVGGMVGAKLGFGDGELAPGSHLWFDGRRWTIAGRFEAPNTVMDAEIWMRLSDLQIVGKRQDVSCVVLTLDPARGGDFADVEIFASQRLDLEIAALSEVEYYSKLAGFYGPIRVLVAITALLCGAGAILGGFDALYAAFAARLRELGTLQVLGFGRGAITIALALEALLICSAGAAFAALLGYLFLDGVAVNFSMGAFALTVDSATIAWSMASGLVLGTVAALTVVARYHTLSIPEALRT